MLTLGSCGAFISQAQNYATGICKLFFVVVEGQIVTVLGFAGLSQLLNSAVVPHKQP